MGFQPSTVLTIGFPLLRPKIKALFLRGGRGPGEPPIQLQFDKDEIWDQPHQSVGFFLSNAEKKSKIQQKNHYETSLDRGTANFQGRTVKLLGNLT